MVTVKKLANSRQPILTLSESLKWAKERESVPDCMRVTFNPYLGPVKGEAKSVLGPKLESIINKLIRLIEVPRKLQ